MKIKFFKDGKKLTGDLKYYYNGYFTVIDREIYKPEFFDTKEEAHKHMCFDVEDVFGDSEAAEIGINSAYGDYGADFDWQIFEVELEK